MSTQPKNHLVWGEIPVSDLDKATVFYSTVTGAHIDRHDTGSNPTALFRIGNEDTIVGLHLYVGKPAEDGRGPSLYLAVDGTVEEALARVDQAGGTVVSPVIEIAHGRFAYIQDPDGNSISLFEMPTAA